MFKAGDVAALSSAQSLFAYNDYEFEYACKYLLEKSGRSKVFVTKKGSKGGDGGVDLQIRSADGAIVAYGQCKQWHTRYKGLVESIRQLAGCMLRDQVKKGILIVTVEANAYEKEEAERCGIEIMDFSVLENMIRKVNIDRPSAPTNTVARDKVNVVPPRKPLWQTCVIFVAKILFYIIATAVMLVLLLLLSPILLFIGLAMLSGGQKRPRRYYRRHSYSYS